ncbi:MAG: cytochrome c [Thermoleophilaceae bacterium]|nr:cytochrome c [Thermoleophilaceae bacterium]
MKALGFFLFWIFAGLGTLWLVYIRASKPAKPTAMRANFSRPTRLALIVLTIGLLIVVPVAVVSSASDRVASGAGTYTVDSSEALRDGRTTFRQTCASCHTLQAAGARGVYAPNLDTLGGLNKARVLSAIAVGGSGQDIMPAKLLQGKDADQVAAYVESVAGAGRN